MTHILADQHFRSYKETKSWVDSWIASKDLEFFQRGIRILPERWEKVLTSEGQYFQDVCRTMKCRKFKYERLHQKFHFTCHIRQRHINAARAFFRSGINWNQVIFSDEKMFTFHGSHCYYAWLNRNMSRRRVRQVVKSSGLMVMLG